MIQRFRSTVSSLSVIALMVGAIIGIGVSPAAADTGASFGIVYSYNPADVSAGATVTDYSGEADSVVIPATVSFGRLAYAVLSAACSAAHRHYVRGHGPHPSTVGYPSY